jgi:hypothetical protein
MSLPAPSAVLEGASARRYLVSSSASEGISSEEAYGSDVHMSDGPALP